MNESHRKKMEDRKKARAEIVFADYETRRKNFLHKAYFEKWGLTATQIEIMWQGLCDLPKNWDWEKFYAWESETMEKWDDENPNPRYH